ncbi:MAG: ClbS/DfsB family four-helix bundle protein [Streptococcaceae bacterium]|nr:ClbS/DfsB family four-helix bundle protein [Streptococcaceae bacterium]
MVKATNKSELISYSQKNWEKLWKLIDDMDEETKNGTFRFNSEGKKEQHWSRDKNIRDVLAHLYEWHKLLLNFVMKNRQGEHISFLPIPYSWKNYGDMNEKFWEKNQKISFEDLKQQIFQTHQELIDLIGTFSNDELYVKKYFNWTGTTSLGQYFQSSLPSHYDWALKKLRLHKKTFHN